MSDSDESRSIIEIPLELLHDSPYNPPERAGLAIDELAANIRAEGRVHQALLVRPLVGDELQWTADAPGLTDTTRGKLTGLKRTDVQLLLTKPLPFVPWRGQLGFFAVPEALAAQAA